MLVSAAVAAVLLFKWVLSGAIPIMINTTLMNSMGVVGKIVDGPKVALTLTLTLTVLK